MRIVRLIASALLLSSLAHAADKPTSTIAFEHASVITMVDERVLQDQTVVIRNGSILAIGPSASTKAPSDAVRVNATGKFLAPGMTDMHAHFAMAETLSEDEIQDEMMLYVANGVTTVRCPAGASLHLKIRDRIANGTLFGPRVFTSGPIMESHPSFPQLLQDKAFRYHQIKSPEDAAAEVRRQKAAGYDFIKIYNQVDPDDYEAIFKTAKEVGIPVFGHVPIQPGLASAFKNHQASIEHLRGYDLELSADRLATKAEIRFAGWPKATDAQLDKLVKQTVDARMWNVPTLMVAKSVDLTPDIRALGVDYPYVPAHQYAHLSASVLEQLYSKELAQLVRDGLPNQCKLVRKLIEAGGNVLAGTDALVPGIAMHGEVRTIASCGVSNFEAFKTATANPGRWFAQYKPDAPRFGTVEQGKAAELVLYDANPLANLSNLDQINGVVSHGRWLDRKNLDTRLEALRTRNAPLIAKIKAANKAK